MNTALLKELLAPHTGPCLTITIPTEVKSFDRDKLKLEVKKKLQQLNNYSGAIETELMESPPVY